MILSGDIPVNISLGEFKDFIIIILICTSSEILYIRKSQLNLLNIVLLSLPTVLWFITLQHSLKYQFNKYDTISDIIGFFSMIIILLYSLYKIIIKYKKRK